MKQAIISYFFQIFVWMKKNTSEPQQNRTLLVIFCPNSETLCKYLKIGNYIALFLFITRGNKV